MSSPTRIYLATLAVVVCFWGAYMVLQPTHAAGPGFRFDPAYSVRHSGEPLGFLVGRVEVGPGVDIPEDGLFVEVRASNGSGEHAVRRIVPLASDGSFEVSGIPVGRAQVTVELASAEVVWEVKDVVVGEMGGADPRIDSIDLQGAVVPFDIRFMDPGGDPVDEGQFLWRPCTGDPEGGPFGTPMGMEHGSAKFLATAELIDVITLVPGASVELFEGVRPGQSIHLGPGTTAALRVTGDLPDRATWTVSAMLVPLELSPALPMAKRGRAATEAVMSAEVDDSNTASIAVSRAGRYRLHWRVSHARRPNKRPIVFEDESQPEVLLGHAAGQVPVERPFPIDRFARALRGRR